MNRWLSLLATFLLATLIGVAGGLLYGLVVEPVRFAEVEPEDLAQRYKEEYLRLVAADYVAGGELVLAQQRLRALGFEPEMVRARAEAATFEGRVEAGALARLAVDIGAGSDRLLRALETPSPTAIPLPSATFLPTATVPPRPSATATPLPTEEAVEPTSPPLVTATFIFTVTPSPVPAP